MTHRPPLIRAITKDSTLSHLMSIEDQGIVVSWPTIFRIEGGCKGSETIDCKHYNTDTLGKQPCHLQSVFFFCVRLHGHKPHRPIVWSDPLAWSWPSRWSRWIGCHQHQIVLNLKKTNPYRTDIDLEKKTSNSSNAKKNMCLSNFLKSRYPSKLWYLFKIYTKTNTKRNPQNNVGSSSQCVRWFNKIQGIRLHVLNFNI